MKLDKERTQAYVDIFLQEIRIGAGIPIEDIVVEEKKLEPPGAIRNYKGKIQIDHDIDFDPRVVSLERYVLHELGHRAQETINPVMEQAIIIALNCRLDMINLRRRYGTLAAYFTHIPHIMKEGIAEVFALDIFPEFCNVSLEGRKFIESEKTGNLPPTLLTEDASLYRLILNQIIGYKFFHELYLHVGINGVVSYLREFSKYKVPTEAELSNPQPYWRQVGILA